MKNNVIRLGTGFAVLLGLAYLGHQVFVQDTPAAAATVAAGASTTAATAVALPADASSYPVYPDRLTEKALGLDYSTFSGDFVHGVTVTPLPPHFPGAALLRVLPGTAHALEIGLSDKRCAQSVHVAVYRIDDRQSVGNAALDAHAPTLSLPFGDGKMPAMLVDIRMDDKAQNNYWCGVDVRWVR